MALRDFWRGDRERYGEDRNRDRDRWRSSGTDWRDADRGRERGGDYRTSDRDYWSERDSGRGNWGGEDRNYGSQQGWSPGGEYYSDRQDPRREGYGGQDYGRSFGRDEERNFGEDYGNRGSGSSTYGRYYGGGGGDYGRDYGGGYRSDWYGGSTFGGDADRGRREAYGYSGYGGMGGAQSGGSAYGGTQQHRGRGPRGYRRSDERIREDVCDCLTDDAQIDASNLEVNVKDCEVTLSGSVNSREDKRRAEDLAENISGVKDVRNNLRISAEQSTGEKTAGERGASPGARH